MKYFMLLYENGDSSTLTPVYFKAIFSQGGKSVLDFPVHCVLSTIIYKQTTVILHEFLFVIKVYAEIL